MAIHVTTRINGEPREFLCDPADSLLSALRDHLNLSGTKEGCNSGDCGACSVKFDGRLACSCLILAAEAEGVEIETIEGVATAGALHPVQQQLLEKAGLQCGICTPGVVVAAKELLARNNNPSEEDVRYWLAGNLCRCTGYDKIIRAVLAAGEQMRAE